MNELKELFLLILLIIAPNTPDYGFCGDTTIPEYKPAIECMRVQVTNFTPYITDEFNQPMLDKNGRLQFYQETNMQCMVPCDITGSLRKITKDKIGLWAACIYDWYNYTITVNDMDLLCVDTFGDSKFQEPYYSDVWNEWVIPVDILTHEPYMFLTESWER